MENQQPPVSSACSGGGLSDVWIRLPLELALHMISFLPANQVACNGRLLCKAAAAKFKGPEYTTIRLSKPVPPEAFAAHWSRPGVTRHLTYEKRWQLVALTAGSGGHPANLIVALGASGWSPHEESIFEAAGSRGCLETCQLLLPLECGLSKQRRANAIMVGATLAGKVNICEWLHEHQHVGSTFPNPRKTPDNMIFTVIDEAITAGQTAVCRLLHDKWYGKTYTEEQMRHEGSSLLQFAAHEGDLDRCKLIHQYFISGTQCFWRTIFKIAAAGGHTHICSWVLTEHRVSLANGLQMAAEEGQSEIITQLLKKATSQQQQSCAGGQKGALKHAGHVDWWGEVLPAVAEHCDMPTLQEVFRWVVSCQILRLAEDKYYKVVSEALNSRTEDWHQKLEWLMDELEQLGVEGEKIEGGLRFYRGTSATHIMTRLIWLQDKGLLSPYVKMGLSDTFFMLKDKLCHHGRWQDLLQLHSRGLVSITEYDVSGVTCHLGQVEELEALLEALGPQVVLANCVVGATVESGSMELVSWMLQHGCSRLVDIEGIFMRGVESGSEVMLEWLVQLGCKMPVDGRPYITAGTRGDLQTMRCLHRLGCAPGEAFTHLIRKTTLPTLPVLRWMAEQRFPLDIQNAIQALDEYRRDDIQRSAVMTWFWGDLWNALYPDNSSSESSEEESDSEMEE